MPWKSRAGRAGIAAALAALLLAGLGAVYQGIGMRLDARRFPRRGKAYRAGGVALNLNCSGEGSPPVILESGLGGSALDWILVQPRVAAFTRVCSYDRAGYGWSDKSAAPRTSRQIAGELKALLEAAAEPGPYLLVGHSFGGYYVRVFAGLYPEDAAGMVLVDASHPAEGERTEALLPPALRAREKREDQRRELREKIFEPLRLHLGIDRFALATGWSQSRYFSKRQREEFLYLEQQPKFLRTVRSEDLAGTESGAQAIAAGEFGSLPLIVLTAGKPYGPDPLLTQEQSERQDFLWIHVLQAEEARLSRQGKQIVVPDSSHDMPTERPDAIVTAIAEVWHAARRHE